MIEVVVEEPLNPFGKVHTYPVALVTGDILCVLIPFGAI
jgi:hypothetical protein